MPLPRPQPGLVICYEFLWSQEHEAGAAQGEKKRPCVVLAIEDRMGSRSSPLPPSLIANRRDRNMALRCRAESKLTLGWTTTDRG
jgi:hypothetical protein